MVDDTRLESRISLSVYGKALEIRVNIRILFRQLLDFSGNEQNFRKGNS